MIRYYSFGELTEAIDDLPCLICVPDRLALIQLGTVIQIDAPDIPPEEQFPLGALVYFQASRPSCFLMGCEALTRLTTAIYHRDCFR
jgi:hypothetical protein